MAFQIWLKKLPLSMPFHLNVSIIGLCILKTKTDAHKNPALIELSVDLYVKAKRGGRHFLY